MNSAMSGFRAAAPFVLVALVIINLLARYYA